MVQAESLTVLQIWLGGEPNELCSKRMSRTARMTANAGAIYRILTDNQAVADSNEGMLSGSSVWWETFVYHRPGLRELLGLVRDDGYRVQAVRSDMARLWCGYEQAPLLYIDADCELDNLDGFEGASAQFAQYNGDLIDGFLFYSGDGSVCKKTFDMVDSVARARGAVDYMDTHIVLNNIQEGYRIIPKSRFRHG